MKKILLLVMLFPTLLLAQSQNPPAPNRRAVEGPGAPGDATPIENFYLIMLLFILVSGLVFFYFRNKSQFVK